MSAAPVFMATSELGEWIERKMAERGINQSQLASFLKPRTSPSVVNAWLNRGSVPSPGMCVALAAFFHVRPEEVMRLAGHLPGEPELPDPDIDEIIPDLQVRIRRFSPAEQRRIVLPLLEAALQLREPTEDEAVDPPSRDDDEPPAPPRRRR